MNSYWQFTKFIQMHEAFLKEKIGVFETYKVKRKRRILISITLISLAIIVAITISSYNPIVLLNIFSIWFLFRNIRSNKKFNSESKLFLDSYASAIKTWKEMPNNQPDSSYEEILTTCREQIQLLLDDNLKDRNSVKREPQSELD